MIIDDDIPRMETEPRCTIMATDIPECSGTASRRAGECSVWRPGTGSVTICYKNVTMMLRSISLISFSQVLRPVCPGAEGGPGD